MRSHTLPHIPWGCRGAKPRSPQRIAQEMDAPLHSSPVPTWARFVGWGEEWKQPNGLPRVRGHGGAPQADCTRAHTHGGGGIPPAAPTCRAGPGRPRCCRPSAPVPRQFAERVRGGGGLSAPRLGRPRGERDSGVRGKRTLSTLGVPAEGAPSSSRRGCTGYRGGRTSGPPIPVLSLPPRCAPGSLQNAGGVPGQHRHLTGSPRSRGHPASAGTFLSGGHPRRGRVPRGAMGAAQGAEASPWGTRRPRSAAGCGRAANGVSAPTALPAPTGGGRAARRDGIPPSAGLSGALRARMGAAAATPQPLSLQNGVRARIPPAAPARASAALAGLRATRPRTDPRSPAPIRAAPAPYGAPGTPSPDRTPSPDPPVPAARSAGAAEPRTENSFPPTRPLPPAHLHRRRRPGRAAPLPPAPSRYIARPAPALRMCEGGRQLPRPAPAPRCPSAAPRPRRPPRPSGHPAVSAARSAPGAAPPRFPP